MLGYLASVGILMAVVSAWAYVETHLPARLESFSCHHPYDCEGCAQVDACELHGDVREGRAPARPG